MTEQQIGGITITFEKMYDEQKQLQGQLGTLITELHDINNAMKTLGLASNDHETRIRLLEKSGVPSEDHERRIRSIERKVYALPSGAIILALITLIITILKH